MSRWFPSGAGGDVRAMRLRRFADDIECNLLECSLLKRNALKPDAWELDILELSLLKLEDEL